MNILDTLKKMFKPKKRINLGIYRISLILWFIIPIIIGGNEGSSPFEIIMLDIVLFIFLYIVFQILYWIYDGFQQSKKQ